MKRLLTKISLLSALAILVAVPFASAVTTTVTPSNKQGWKSYSKDGGTVVYVEDPTVGDGFGASTLQFKTDNTVASQACRIWQRPLAQTPQSMTRHSRTPAVAWA